jgi:nicotinate phosphoribosyltransferase
MSSTTTTSSPTTAAAIGGVSTNSNSRPTNNLVRALLTDLYQLTMTYSHWKIGKVNEPAVFELFFRKNPFEGEYTIFCGLDESLNLLQSFQFTVEDIDYLKSTPALQHCDTEFFDEYLLHGLNDALSSLKVYSVPEGTVVFPKCPLLIIEGTLGIGHLLETTLLNLINYPSLIATNASRMVLRANEMNEHHTNYCSSSTSSSSSSSKNNIPNKPCLEFGLRRAQGPDGACKFVFVQCSTFVYGTVHRVGQCKTYPTYQNGKVILVISFFFDSRSLSLV